MPGQRKKKVLEPALKEPLPEKNEEIDEINSEELVDTVEAAIALAVKNISNIQEQPVISENESVELVSEQDTEQDTEQDLMQAYGAISGQITDSKNEIVYVLTEQVSVTKEDSIADASDAVKIVSEMPNVIEDSVSKTKTKTNMLLEAVNSKKNMKIVISQNATNLLIKIASSMPNMLDDIKKSLLEVISDGKIDSNDIPSFISIIQDLYASIYAMKDLKFDNRIRASICAEILKYISHFLILDEQIKVVKVNQEVLLNQIDRLIDSCVSLLTFSSAIKIQGCFPFLCK